MKWFKRILTALLVLVFVLSLAGFFYIRYLARKGLPDYNSDVRLANTPEGLRYSVIHGVCPISMRKMNRISTELWDMS